MTIDARQRRDSWKEIAAHLGRNVRTVIRWEKDRGLPVHRVPGGRARTVFAYTEELDRWLESDQGRASESEAIAQSAAPRIWSRSSVVIAASLLIVLAAGYGWWRAATPFTIGSLVAAGDALEARAPGGQTLWRYVPDRSALDPREGRLWHAVRNLDGRSGDEVVAAGMSGWETPEALLMLSNGGQLRWLRSFGETHAFGDRQYGPPWRTAGLVLFAVKGAPRIAWVMHHHTWSPAVIATYDAEGRLLDRYVHNGWLTNGGVSRDGRFLLAVGVSNERNAYVFLALDVEAPRVPSRYMVLPRSELSIAANLPLLNNGDMPHLIVLPSGAIEVRISDQPVDMPAAETIFEFREDLSFAGAQVGDTYWNWHRHLEAAGLVQHTAADCPDRRRPPVLAGSP